MALLQPKCQQFDRHTPGGQFPVFPTITQDLRAVFCPRCTGMLEVPDFILCTNNPITGKMLVKIKARHNLSTNLTLCECAFYICQQAINDIVSNRLDHIMDDNFTSYDIDDDKDDDDENCSDNSPDDDYIPSDDNNYSSKKRKSSSKQIGSRKKVITSSSKGITTIEYIGGGIFEKVMLFHVGSIKVTFMMDILIEDAHHVDLERLTKEKKKN
ncbi:hypothetical protein C1645_849432 [Glomus cerebriforme]|uniref:Uncharacterized protein n=1 Tax=Glomus cerebriforme TaxID=658196 RepID=A0A397SZ52_9GLOM|nr:hypothetical protein C1645_849432 [Glomus cerebriforme]